MNCKSDLKGKAHALRGEWLLCVLSTYLIIAPPVRADTMTTVYSIPSGLSASIPDYYSNIVTLPVQPFNPSLGSLGSVDVSIYVGLYAHNPESGHTLIFRLVDPRTSLLAWTSAVYPSCSGLACLYGVSMDSAGFPGSFSFSDFSGRSSVDVSLLGSEYGFTPSVTPISTIPGGTLTVVYNYTPVSSVPEPRTYVMLLTGLGLIGFTTLRRKDFSA
jgi:hypothetical protein